MGKSNNTNFMQIIESINSNPLSSDGGFFGLIQLRTHVFLERNCITLDEVEGSPLWIY